MINPFLGPIKKTKPAAYSIDLELPAQAKKLRLVMTGTGYFPNHNFGIWADSGFTIE